MNSEIKILRSIKPEEFTLVCGLPGMAHAGKIPVDYMIQQLNAELIGEIYSTHFPPYVIINKGGLVELLRNEFLQVVFYLLFGGERKFGQVI